MIINEIALVLSGGGAKGAYQIGVWKYLREAGLEKKITAISGASIGALNAALFVQGNLWTAERIWSSLSMKDLIQPDINLPRFLADSIDFAETHDLNADISTVIKKVPEFFYHIGIFSRSSLEKIINMDIDLALVSSSDKFYYSACCKLPEYKPEYFLVNYCTPEKIKNILLATSAIPGVFEAVKIGNSLYYDGGLVDNVPIKPLYDLGYRKFIVVNLNIAKEIDRSPYPNSIFWELWPIQHKKFFDHATFDFNERDSLIRMRLGYLDASQSLESVNEHL